MNIHEKAFVRGCLFERHKFSNYIWIYATQLRIFSLIITWLLFLLLRPGDGCKYFPVRGV